MFHKVRVAGLVNMGDSHRGNGNWANWELGEMLYSEPDMLYSQLCSLQHLMTLHLLLSCWWHQQRREDVMGVYQRKSRETDTIRPIHPQFHDEWFESTTTIAWILFISLKRMNCYLFGTLLLPICIRCYRCLMLFIYLCIPSFIHMCLRECWNRIRNHTTDSSRYLITDCVRWFDDFYWLVSCNLH